MAWMIERGRYNEKIGREIEREKKKSERERRSPHELFPQKGVPHQIPAGLEILRKFNLAWRL